MKLEIFLKQPFTADVIGFRQPKADRYASLTF